MKSNITDIEEKTRFKPFKIEIEVETEEEARLLYHVFNYGGNLKSMILSSGGYDPSKIFNKNIKENLVNEKMYLGISERVGVNKEKYK